MIPLRAPGAVQVLGPERPGAARWFAGSVRTYGKEVMGMQCVRCNGLMVADRFVDLADDSGQLMFAGWRCLVCGNISDPIIVANRHSPPPAQKPLRKRAVAA